MMALATGGIDLAGGSLRVLPHMGKLGLGVEGGLELVAPALLVAAGGHVDPVGRLYLVRPKTQKRAVDHDGSRGNRDVARDGKGCAQQVGIEGAEPYDG